MKKFFVALLAITSIKGMAAEKSGMDLLNGIGKAPHVVQSRKPHQVQVLNSGPATLTRYLDMIDRATTDINVLNYMFVPGNVGKIVGKALIEKKAKNPNIKINLYVDFYGWAGAPALNDIVSKYFVNAGIELAYFNTSQIPHKLNYRDHRKIFIIDGLTKNAEAIVGGRSLEDGCFELGEDYYNYLDRDIWVKGPIAKSIKQDFDVYWNSDLTAKGQEGQDLLAMTTADMVKKALTSQHPDEPRYQNIQKMYAKSYEDYLIGSRSMWAVDEKGNEIKEEWDKVAKIKAKAIEIGREDLSKSPVLTVPAVAFVSPDPALNASAMYQGPALASILKGAESSIFMENYSFVPAGEIKEILWDKAINSPVKILVLTNNFMSTDEKDIAWMDYRRQKKFRIPEEYEAVRASQGFTKINIMGYDGKMLKGKKLAIDLSEENQKLTSWGIHSKTIVTDMKNVWIGSFNIDSRSMFYSKEAAIYVPDSPELAKVIQEMATPRLFQGVITGTDKKYYYYRTDGTTEVTDIADHNQVGLELLRMRLFNFLFGEWLY